MAESYPIVGSFYRPPAKALIQSLPVGTPLTVRAEPDNPVDPNAIAVWLKSKDLTEAALAELDMLLSGFGYTIQQILDSKEWQLGYLPKEIAEVLRGNDSVKAGEDIQGTFRCAASGAPRVEFGD